MIASVAAYADPGNFATNIEAGGRHGYELVWVIIVANAIAMLFPVLAAKLGVATGTNLAELCRERFPARVVIAMRAASKIAAMAAAVIRRSGGTSGDIAAFLAAAIVLALNPVLLLQIAGVAMPHLSG